MKSAEQAEKVRRMPRTIDSEFSEIERKRRRPYMAASFFHIGNHISS